MKLLYSPVCQMWLLVWHDQVIERYQAKNDAVIDLRYKGLSVSRGGKVKVAESTQN